MSSAYLQETMWEWTVCLLETSVDSSLEDSYPTLPTNYILGPLVIPEKVKSPTNE